MSSCPGMDMVPRMLETLAVDFSSVLAEAEYEIKRLTAAYGRHVEAQERSRGLSQSTKYTVNQQIHYVIRICT